jgi:hypothetical protein
LFFDNCTGQNKNNTVLKLPAWLVQCGYFLEVNFIFLVVGHTKNAANHLFNLLKKDYRKKKIYTFDKLIKNLSASSSVTVYPAEAADFLPYNKLLGMLYKDLTGNIMTNHIFSCRSGNDDEIVLRKSALEDTTSLSFESFINNINMHLLVRCLRLPTRCWSQLNVWE